MAIAVLPPLAQFFDNSGNVLNGGSVTVQDATTTTPHGIYTDTGLSIPATNPIPLDSAGRTTQGVIYAAATAYKLILKTSAGVTVRTEDSIDPGVPIGSGVLAIANGGTGATTAEAAIAALGGATAAEVADIAAAQAALSGTLASTEKTHIATGTTAQRPGTPVEGDVRRNTTTSLYEVYTGSAWINLSTYPGSTPHPTVQTFTSGTGATYTTPSNVIRLRIRMLAGGGGGGAQVTNDGADGTNSSWAVSGGTTWTAVKGSKGVTNGGAGGAGGTGGVDGTGTKILRTRGGSGSTGYTTTGLSGRGGGTVLGSGGAPVVAVDGEAATTNTGAGGSGGSNGGGTAPGGGGGGGEYVEFWLTGSQVKATHTYTVGAGGAGGAAGTRAGGNGAAGVIVVEEFYL